MKKSARTTTPRYSRDHARALRPIPLDPERLNSSPALWAAVALEEFRRQTGADLEDAVSDLLADLMHWCDRFGQEFQNEFRRAMNHYSEETATDPQRTALLKHEI